MSFSLPEFDLGVLLEQRDRNLIFSFFQIIEDMCRWAPSISMNITWLDDFFTEFTARPTRQTISIFNERLQSFIEPRQQPLDINIRLESVNEEEAITAIVVSKDNRVKIVGYLTGFPFHRLEAVLASRSENEMRRVLPPHPQRRLPDVQLSQYLPQQHPRLSFSVLDEEEEEEEEEENPEDRFSLDSAYQDLYTSFGYTNTQEMAEDIRNLIKQILTHQDENVDDVDDIDDVTENQISAFEPLARVAAKIVLRTFENRLARGDSNFTQNIEVSDIEEDINTDIGSGSLTYMLSAAYYFIWRYIVLHPQQERITRDMVTTTWQFEMTDDFADPEITGRVRLDIPHVLFENPRRNWIIERIRQLFKYIHIKIQKGLGEQNEYWYHGSTDFNAQDLVRLYLTINGTTLPRIMRSRRGFFYEHPVNQDNRFWNGIFNYGNNAQFNAECQKNAIMIPDNNLEGRVLSGCFERALFCICPRGTIYCRCHDTTQYPEVALTQIPEKYKDHPIMVIVINVYTQTSHKPKDYQVLFVHPDYFKTDNTCVIMINNPNWPNGHAHCCLFKVPDPPFDVAETPFENYKRHSFFNEMLHHITKSRENVCPICGLLYPKTEMKAHFRDHMGGIFCEECGINFKDETALDIHSKFHCRHLGVGCKYDFADEIKGYVDKPEKDRCIIYADLESAIQEDGTHKNILCGWVDTSNMQVVVRNNIKALIDHAKEVPNSEVLIYFHNGEGYDFHFVIIELSKMENIMENIDIIADSSEKIRYFTINLGKTKRIIFKDTFAYVSQSLSSWLESTKKSPDAVFTCFNETFKDPEKRELIMQKNPFPYNAIKSAQDLDMNIDILDQWFCAENNTELFCDKFTEEELKEIYEHWYLEAKLTFNWRTVKDYYKTYLQCDVSQLCDCMEHFCANVMKEFGLDAHNYYGTPSLTWAAWLKQNDYTLDPIPEEGFDVINSSIRGGQTGAMTRYYNSEEGEIDEGSFCCDLDCNALYATVMMKFKFPCRRWMVRDFSTEEVDNHYVLTWIKQLHDTGRSGFIEVDMNVKDDPSIYSYVPVASKRQLHGIYNYQAMADYASGGGEKYENFVFVGLANVVGDHKHYCAHTRLMEFYITHGFITISKMYRLVYALEEPVFQKYVEHNLAKRKEFSDDPIKKMLYKLMNNALYGKTYEDITQRTEVKVVKRSDYDRLQQSEIKREIMKLDKWVIYEIPKRSFLMDKPIYLGAAITEYSKLWMYHFFYDEIRPHFYGSEVLYTDTDALTIRFPAHCGVRSFMDIANRLNTPEHQVIDTSNWKNCRDLPSLHTAHNNEPGLFKSETGDGRIVKMIALRAKTYIMLCDDGTIKMSVKGCPMKEKANLTFEDFETVLKGNGIKKVIEYDAITSKYHIVKSSKLTRVVLSADDRKRYISPDKIHTFPLFSKAHQDALGNISLETEITEQHPFTDPHQDLALCQ